MYFISLNTYVNCQDFSKMFPNCQTAESVPKDFTNSGFKYHSSVLCHSLKTSGIFNYLEKKSKRKEKNPQSFVVGAFETC